MHWNKLLSEKRYNRQQNKSLSPYDLRNEFQKDYHRIISSAAFRRLQDKTQVFPLDKSDFVRTRLTHSIETASFGRSLGQNIFSRIISQNANLDMDNDKKEKICCILECAGLIHDIGNPPFGHFGESCIRDWFKTNLHKYTYMGKNVTEILSRRMLMDLYNFEGNAQALRLLSKLHFLVDENGMHLTYGLLNTIVKYPVSSENINKNSGNIKDKKMGYFLAEEELFKEISQETGALDRRHPLTYILEAADDIAYMTADIEDAVKKGLITYSVLKTSLEEYKNISENKEENDFMDKVIGKLETCYERSKNNVFCNEGGFFETNAVQNWIVYIQGVFLGCAADGFVNNYKEIMDGNFNNDIISVTKGRICAKALKETAYKYAFCSDGIIRMELSASTIYNGLLEKFVSAAIKYETEEISTEAEKKLMRVVSDNYKTVYKIFSQGKSENEKLYMRLLLVTDFICGMTDSYARDLYRQIKGI